MKMVMYNGFYMDASYNNSFGSFGTGDSSPGNGVTPVGGGVAGGPGAGGANGGPVGATNTVPGAGGAMGAGMAGGAPVSAAGAGMAGGVSVSATGAGMAGSVPVGAAGVGVTGAGATGVSEGRAGGLIPGRKKTASERSVMSGMASSGMGYSGNMMQNGGMAYNDGVISSGTGDIVLSSGGDDRPRSRKKKWIIAGSVALGVSVVLLLVALGFSGGFGGGGVKASNAREAFNLYANYFLTGEVSKADMVMEENDTDDLIDDEISLRNLDDAANNEEEEEEEEIIQEIELVLDEEDVEGDGQDITPMDEEAEPTEVLSQEQEEGESEEGMSYFDSHLVVDSEYRSNLLDYFIDFHNILIEEMGEEQDEDMMSYLEEYKTKLEIVILYYSGADLNETNILESYNSDGEDGAKSYIEKITNYYKDYNTIYDESFYDLMVGYGTRILMQVMKYDEYGCIVDGVIDYECVSGQFDEEDEIIENDISDYYSEIQSILTNAIDDLHSDLYIIRDYLYVDEDLTGEDEE